MRSKIANEYIDNILARKTPYFKSVNRIKLRIDKGVYPTGKIGNLFYKALSNSKFNLNKKMVLDYGTGTGFLAIVSAKKGARVVAIDKSPLAIKCAKYNAQQNNVSNQIDFRISNNLSAIRKTEKFDLILAGLPWENATPTNSLEMAFYDAKFSMRKALYKQANIILSHKGIILISYAKRIQDKLPIEKFFPGFYTNILVEKIIDGELHYIFGLRLPIKKDFR